MKTKKRMTTEPMIASLCERNFRHINFHWDATKYDSS